MKAHTTGFKENLIELRNHDSTITLSEYYNL